MASQKQQPLIIALLCYGCLATIAAGWFGWRTVESQLRIAFAEEQTHVFREMRDRAAQENDPEAIQGLKQYVLEYYPSGTKQRSGTRLDQIVETTRQDCLDTINDRQTRLNAYDSDRP